VAAVAAVAEALMATAATAPTATTPPTVPDSNKRPTHKSRVINAHFMIQRRVINVDIICQDALLPRNCWVNNEHLRSLPATMTVTSVFEYTVGALVGCIEIVGSCSQQNRA
jgi:hypothetical protein